MYSAVVSASSTSPTNSEANAANSKTEQVGDNGIRTHDLPAAPRLQQYPPMPKLKSSPILKDPLEVDSQPRSPTESGGGGPYSSLV